MMRNYLHILLLIIGMSPWAFCHAEDECHFTDGGPATVDYNNIDLGVALGQNTPVGTVVYDSYQESSKSGNAACTGNALDYAEGYATLPSPAVGGSDPCLYTLPLADGTESGLGIKIYYQLGGSGAPNKYCLKYPLSHKSPQFVSKFTAEGSFRIVVQVIGQLHSGTVAFSRFSGNGIWWNGLLAFEITFTDTFLDVKALTCDINTPEIPVSLTAASGISMESTFKGINSTSTPVDFTIDLTCDKDVNVAVRFEGDTQSGSNNQVLKLTEQDNSATGIGIQILDKDKNIMSFNQPDFALQASNVQQSQVSLPFSARYIQTSSQVTGGKADAEATFFLAFP
ncbi:fimbrial protein [Citrobacter portucalensis]|uniref:fimbrial protein n=1 Tax=Citrobacter portucalensis TaxID=1639133 RepID=UPI003BF53BBB